MNRRSVGSNWRSPRLPIIAKTRERFSRFAIASRRRGAAFEPPRTRNIPAIVRIFSSPEPSARIRTRPAAWRDVSRHTRFETKIQVARARSIKQIVTEQLQSQHFLQPLLSPNLGIVCSRVIEPDG